MGESGVGWALIRGWALSNFFSLSHERLFEVSANSRLRAYSNKYGMSTMKIKTSTFDNKNVLNFKQKHRKLKSRFYPSRSP